MPTGADCVGWKTSVFRTIRQLAAAQGTRPFVLRTKPPRIEVTRCEAFLSFRAAVARSDLILIDLLQFALGSTSQSFGLSFDNSVL